MQICTERLRCLPSLPEPPSARSNLLTRGNAQRSFAAMFGVRFQKEAEFIKCGLFRVDEASTESTTLPALHRAKTGYFAQWSYYADDAAIVFRPMPPTFRMTFRGTYHMKKQGVLFLETTRGTGRRDYDWRNKLVRSCAALFSC